MSESSSSEGEVERDDYLIQDEEVNGNASPLFKRRMPVDIRPNTGQAKIQRKRPAKGVLQMCGN